MATYKNKAGNTVYDYSSQVDYYGIKKICDNIDAQAKKLSQVANEGVFKGANLERAANNIQSDKVLMVNGQHYDVGIRNLSAGLLTIKGKINAATKAIKNEAWSKYNAEYNAYQSYLRESGGYSRGGYYY